ncbi:hypothetical protein, partial [Staphylococcus aureus]|uniref:hypothetical protein n=1 Tax=Staphylococcus aureus TaxID=1280 RepID=UPI00204056C1
LFAFQCKMYLGHVKVLLGMFLSLKTLYRKRTVIWPFYFYTIIRTLSENVSTKSENISEIKILGINQEEVTVPKMDGTRGSGLYSIPFLLNQCPSREWCEIFINKWDHPRHYSTMHRPGIAKVVEDKIILEGTTIQEVKKYHRDTLIMCVNDTNEEYKILRNKEIKQQQNELKKVKDFKNSLNKNINDIKF